MMLGLDEWRRRRRVTHIEGFQPARPLEPMQAGTSGGSASGDGVGAMGGGMMPIGEVSFEIPNALDAPDAPDPSGLRRRQEQEAQLKVWSTFKMFEDEELQREQDILEMLKRLREAAQLDAEGVQALLEGSPEAASKITEAISRVTAASEARLWLGPSGTPKASGGDVPTGSEA